MEKINLKEYIKDETAGEIKIPKIEKKKLGKGSIIKIKGRHKIDMVSTYGVFGSASLTGAVVTDQHKFPKSEFVVEDEFKVGGYVTNDNEYEVQGMSKTGNAVILKMAGKEVLVFKKCIEVVE